SEIYDPLSKMWTLASNMLLSRIQHGATLLSSGKVLATGGNILPVGELYDYSSDTWTPVDKTSSERFQHTATVLLSGDVLIA
ncbi:unnamed protein product, partial [Rotaria magnacalcarata]